MTPEERGEKAASLKKSGTANCCHSVLLSYSDLLPMDEEAAPPPPAAHSRRFAPPAWSCGVRKGPRRAFAGASRCAPGMPRPRIAFAMGSMRLRFG